MQSLQRIQILANRFLFTMRRCNLDLQSHKTSFNKERMGNETTNLRLQTIVLNNIPLHLLQISNRVPVSLSSYVSRLQMSQSFAKASSISAFRASSADISSMALDKAAGLQNPLLLNPST